MRILEWNINQRANHINTEIIPPFIAQGIRDEDPDFFILTEFYKVKRWEEFQEDLSEYQLFTTDNSQHHQNDVCIGVKNTYPDAQIASLMESHKDNHFPNFLHVIVETQGRTLNIFGVRIRVPSRKDVPAASEENQRYRLEQLMLLESYIAYVPEPSIILGDFNNYRRGHSPATLEMLSGAPQTKCALWNMHVVQEKFQAFGYEMHTPEGYSWGRDNPNVKYQFAQDHVFIKGVNLLPGLSEIEDYHGEYSDYFMKLAPEVYGEEGIRGILTPYPDHKMLIVEFEI